MKGVWLRGRVWPMGAVREVGVAERGGRGYTEESADWWR